MKLLADPQSGEIFGGTCVGPVGGELIPGLAARPYYHPTLAEIWTCPAEALAERLP